MRLNPSRRHREGIHKPIDNPQIGILAIPVPVPAPVTEPSTFNITTTAPAPALSPTVAQLPSIADDISSAHVTVMRLRRGNELVAEKKRTAAREAEVKREPRDPAEVIARHLPEEKAS